MYSGSSHFCMIIRQGKSGRANRYGPIGYVGLFRQEKQQQSRQHGGQAHEPDLAI